MSCLKCSVDLWCLVGFDSSASTPDPYSFQGWGGILPEKKQGVIIYKMQCAKSNRKYFFISSYFAARKSKNKLNVNDIFMVFLVSFSILDHSQKVGIILKEKDMIEEYTKAKLLTA